MESHHLVGTAVCFTWMDHCANKVEELSVLLNLFVATVLIFSLFILLDQVSKIQAADREIDYWLILLFEKVILWEALDVKN